MNLDLLTWIFSPKFVYLELSNSKLCPLTTQATKDGGVLHRGGRVPAPTGRKLPSKHRKNRYQQLVNLSTWVFPKMVFAPSFHTPKWWFFRRKTKSCWGNPPFKVICPHRSCKNRLTQKPISGLPASPEPVIRKTSSFERFEVAWICEANVTKCRYLMSAFPSLGWVKGVVWWGWMAGYRFMSVFLQLFPIRPCITHIDRCI